MYLIDANVLITAHNSYYAVDAVPEFWEWMKFHAESGSIKMPLEIFEEVKDGSDDRDRDLLFDWISDDAVKMALILDEDVNPDLVAQVVSEGYANNLTDQEIDQVGRDPFLIAYGLRSPSDRCIVTTEVSSPRKQRQNRKIPDVCATMGVSCMNTFPMLKALNFSTSWNIR